MYDVEVEGGKAFASPLAEGRQLAGFVLAGTGTVSVAEEAEEVRFKDFFLMTPEQAATFTLRASDEKLRVVFIDVPVQTSYPLYTK